MTACGKLEVLLYETFWNFFQYFWSIVCWIFRWGNIDVEGQLYVPQLLYPFIHQCTLSNLVRVLTTVKNSAMNLGCIYLFWNGLYDSSCLFVCLFWGTSIMLHRGSTNLYFHRTVPKVFLASTFMSTHVMKCFLMIAILTDVRWCLCGFDFQFPND